MAASFFRDFPPYSGEEPYVYLCFHEADKKRVKPFLSALIQRRCRVWYCIGDAQDAEQNRANAQRAGKAALMVFFLTPRSVEDETVKSNLGHFQASGRPVICIETEACAEQSGFSLILSKRVPRIACKVGESAESIVSKLLRTEGFTQEFIAPDDYVWQHFLKKRKSRKIALITLAIALAVLTSAFFYAKSNDFFRPDVSLSDTVTIEDPVFEQAARVALSPDGEAALTDESLSRITTLRLESAPASFDALKLFPALTRLEVPSSCVYEASALLQDASFTIVVYQEAGE